MKKNYKGLLVIIGLALIVLIALAIADEPAEDMDEVYMSNSVNVEMGINGSDNASASTVSDVTAEEEGIAAEETADNEMQLENPVTEPEASEAKDESAIDEVSVCAVPDAGTAEEPVDELTEEPAEATEKSVDAATAELEEAGAGDVLPTEDKEERPFEYLRDEDGNLVLDEKGMPIPLADEGYAIIATYEMDEDGNLVLDENGAPVVIDYEVRYINLDVRIELIILDEDGILTYGSNVRLQAIVENAPEGVELNYEWYNSADWEHPLPVDGDRYDFVVDHDNAMYSWRVDVWF